MTLFSSKSPMWEHKRYLTKLPATMSGRQTSSALIYTGECLILKVKLFGNGSAEATLTLYDALTATGTPITEAICEATSKDVSGEIWPDGAKIATGIYAALTGAGARYYIEYYIPEFGDVPYI